MPKIRVKNLPVTTLVEADVDVPDGPPGTLQARIAGAVLSGRWARTASGKVADLDLEADDQSLDGTWEFKVVPYIPSTPATPSRRASMTFGTLPSREQFDAGWDATVADLGAYGLRDPHLFRFGNDRRMGTCSLTRDELWEEVVRAHLQYGTPGPGAEEAGDWCSSVLGRLGIEWV